LETIPPAWVIQGDLLSRLTLAGLLSKYA